VNVSLDFNVDVNVDGQVKVNALGVKVQPASQGLGLRQGQEQRRTAAQPGRRVGRYRNMLSFQRLEVYQRAIERLMLVNEIVNDLGAGHAERADQVVRSAESILRNIAEGSGRWSRPDSAKHYKIARGEAMEVAASLDVLCVRKLVSAERNQRGERLLESIVSMLTKMAR
jgi:four helix bundle protein